MSKMDEYWDLVSKVKGGFPDLRYGQVLWYALEQLDNSFSQEVHLTNIDPFYVYADKEYQQSVIDAFLIAVTDHFERSDSQ